MNITYDITREPNSDTYIIHYINKDSGSFLEKEMYSVGLRAEHILDSISKKIDHLKEKYNRSRYINTELRSGGNV